MHSAHTTESLHSLDLNLLAALDALLEHRNVTRAAERVGVTQSAMSHTLRRLRDVFDDDLLLRGKRTMLLTPRAQSLVTPLRGALVSLARAIGSPPVFDPAQSERAFRVASPDLFDTLTVPPLLARLTAIAPRVQLSFSASYDAVSDRLETGDLDLAVAPMLVDADSTGFGVQLGGDLVRRTLFRDSFRCFVRAGHSAVTKSRRLTAKRYAELPHVLVSAGPSGPSFVDRVLKSHGLARRVALRVPHFATALEIVATTDLVLTAPQSAAGCRAADGLVSLAPPVALPKHAVALAWHPRFSADPGHRWLRELLAEVAAEVTGSAARRQSP